MRRLKERKQIIQAGRQMIHDGLTVSTLGNISVRLRAVKTNNELVLITPSGLDYTSLTPGDLVILNMVGQVIEGKQRPSSEAPMHLAIYRHLPSVNAIVHSHPPFATALSIVRRPLPAVHYLVQVLGSREVPVADYATFGTDELAQNVVKALASGKGAALMANHGAITVGYTLEEAYSRALILEHLAEAYIYAQRIGEPTTLTASQLQEVEEQLKSFKQKG